MDEFALQQRLFREFTKRCPSLQEGMESAIAAVRNAPHGKAWAACTPVDWSMGQARWSAWLERLLNAHPVPKETGLLWFEIPSELNSALTSVSAYAHLDREDESLGMGEGRTWPEDHRGYTIDEALLLLPELDALFAEAGWTLRGDDRTQDLLRPGVYALSHAYATLLVINGLPRTTLLSRLSAREGVGVVVGWAEGDIGPVGMLSDAGWRPLAIDRCSTKARPEELDPNRLGFNLRKYLANGRDPNWRDPRTGETLLMRERYSDPAVIRALVQAGADVNAADKKGASVIQYFGACALETLQLLLAKGADPHRQEKDGGSLLDRVVGDGRCTLEHLELLWRAGVRPGKDTGPIPRPIRELADSGLYDLDRETQIKKMLRFWIDRGMDINAHDRDGRSALWVALESHARELTDHLSWLRKNEDLGGQWDYAHDEVALILLEHDADPNARLKRSKEKLIPRDATPLMVRRYDDEKLVRALLKHGADPLARCARGRTALDYAQEAAKDSRRLDVTGAGRVAGLLERATQRASR